MTWAGSHSRRASAWRCDFGDRDPQVGSLLRVDVIRVELPSAVGPSDDSERLSAAAAREFQFVWRSLRRLGVRPDDAVDDAAQRVFEIATQKRALIRAGCERAFFLKTAVFVAKESRRAVRRHFERFGGMEVEHVVDTAPTPEWGAEQLRFRERLDAVLDRMPFEFRVVFVLFELEELSSLEIASLLGLPGGTVASRLRRARELFQQETRAFSGDSSRKRGAP